ncbi:NACHT domain-containing protein [Acidovorax sp. Q11]
MITTAILTVAGGAIWEALSPKIIESAHASAKSKWSKFKWSASFETYKNRLIEQYSTTKLLGNPKPIRIDHIYTDVYVLDKITAYRRLEIDKKSGQLKEFSSIPEATKRFPLLDIARDHSRIYVLGKPGAEKSTFLKKVCLLCCNGTIPKTPIFISLKEWYDSEIEIEKFIADEFAACGFPDAELFIDTLLQSGSAILLLDGLDEIPPDNDSRQKAITALTRFTRKNSSTQVILTCRIAAAEYSFDQFKYYEIADFTPEQQKHFTQKWYDNNENASAKFNEQWNIKENNGLRELARTPFCSHFCASPLMKPYPFPNVEWTFIAKLAMHCSENGTQPEAFGETIFIDHYLTREKSNYFRV